MSKATTVKQVLIAARWMLDNIGWAQNRAYVFPDAPIFVAHDPVPIAMCSDGAIDLVEADVFLKRGAREQIMLTVYENIVSWNDDEDRTKEQVLAAFDQAIKDAG